MVRSCPRLVIRAWFVIDVYRSPAPCNYRTTPGLGGWYSNCYVGGGIRSSILEVARFSSLWCFAPPAHSPIRGSPLAPGQNNLAISPFFSPSPSLDSPPTPLFFPIIRIPERGIRGDKGDETQHDPASPLSSFGVARFVALFVRDEVRGVVATPPLHPPAALDFPVVQTCRGGGQVAPLHPPIFNKLSDFVRQPPPTLRRGVVVLREKYVA